MSLTIALIGWRARTRYALALAFAFVQLSVPCRTADAQLVYDHTSFLNGFHSDTNIWKIEYAALGVHKTPPLYIGQWIDLRIVGLANVDKDSVWAAQVQSLSLIPLANEHHVFVAHSLGGLVARGLYIDKTNLRPAVAGIITMASPHEGTLLADNATQARDFLVDVQRRVNDGAKAVRIELIVLGLVGMVASGGTGALYYAAAPAFMGLSLYVAVWQPGAEINLDQIKELAQTPVLKDLKTESDVIKHLKASTDDAAIQRANIYGITPIRNAAIRIKQSLANDDAGFDKAVKERDNGMKAFRACKVVGYVTIVMSNQARRCAYAAKALGRVDDKWAGFVNGTETRMFAAGPIQIPMVVGRTVPFDGIVSNERSVYPGLNDLTRDFPAAGPNHQNIYSTRIGLDKVVAGMKRFQMVQIGALSAAISGPSSIVQGKNGTWTATASGGLFPYSYQWSGILTGTGISITGAGDGVLLLDITDAAGAHSTAQKNVSITVPVGCGTKKIC